MCFDVCVSLLFQLFTHMIECNAQMPIKTRNREITVAAFYAIAAGSRGQFCQLQ